MDAPVMSNKNIGGQDSILLKGAPGWWSEHVYPSPEAIGFIYANTTGTGPVKKKQKSCKTRPTLGKGRIILKAVTTAI